MTTMTIDRKSTRLNSSHLVISYAVFCLKKKIVVLVLFFMVLGQTTTQSRTTQTRPHQSTLPRSRRATPPRNRNMRQRRRCFFFNDTATTEIYTLSLHDALPI